MEACVTSVTEAVASEAAGAHRLELCVRLETGGLTPPPELVAEVKAAVAIPVFAMARRHPGTFAMTPREAAQTLEDVEMLAGAGADGVVLGFLDANGAVDRLSTRAGVLAAAGLPVTFHRAFDEVADPLAGLEILAHAGVRRVLTAGGVGAARDHEDVLTTLVRAAGPVEILVGGGLREDHVAHVVAVTGAREVHARAEGIPGVCRALAAGSNATEVCSQ